MAFRTLPDQAYLQQVFSYDPEVGVLIWKERPLEHFKRSADWKTWNTCYANKPAGGIAQTYIKICLDSEYFGAHRIIYKWMTGDDPHDIDHKDGNGYNNKWSNIRNATRSQNMFNKASYGTKLPKGVSANPPGWLARIRANGTTYCLGTYETIAEARAAYCGASIVLHGEFAYTGPEDATHPRNKRFYKIKHL